MWQEHLQVSGVDLHDRDEQVHLSAVHDVGEIEPLDLS